MIKRVFVLVFLVVLCVSCFAQKEVKQWEYLAVYDVVQRVDPETRVPFGARNYYFVNENKSLAGGTDIGWLIKAGWELVGAAAGGETVYTGLYFKRAYDPSRTQKEIKEVEKSFEKEKTAAIALKTGNELKASQNAPVDLDAVEAKEKLRVFNLAAEKKLRTAFEQIKEPQFKIFSITGNSDSLNRERLRAEIVIDGTSLLLKDGNYRLSEARNYLKETTARIRDQIGIVSDPNIYISSRNQKIGTQGPYGDSGVFIRMSLIVRYNNEEYLLAQTDVRGEWKKE